MWPFNSSGSTIDVVEPTPGLSDNHRPDAATDQRQPTTYPPTQLTNVNERLSLVFPVRLPCVAGAAFVGGLLIGGAKGGFIAADRYRAENAHRLPISRSGWYLYHKSKNYHSVIGSLKEGSKQGVVLMAWAALFTTTEEVIDRARARLFVKYDNEENEDEQITVHSQRDAVSTVMAGLTVSGLYSWKQGFDKFGAARMAKVSLKYSLIYGLLQDTLATLRGHRPGYVKWITSKFPGSQAKRDPI